MSLYVKLKQLLAKFKESHFTLRTLFDPKLLKVIICDKTEMDAYLEQQFPDIDHMFSDTVESSDCSTSGYYTSKRVMDMQTVGSVAQDPCRLNKLVKIRHKIRNSSEILLFTH